MTESQMKIVSLIEAREELTKNLKAVHAELDPLLRTEGEGAMFQDTEGIVYRISVPTGTFVEFRTIGYDRTRKKGEVKGTLSMKDAEAAGFVLPKGE